MNANTSGPIQAAPRPPAPPAPRDRSRISADSAPHAGSAPIAASASRFNPNATDVTRSDLPPQPPSKIAEAASPYTRLTRTGAASKLNEDPRVDDEIETLKGFGRAVVKNMDASLEVPTATSARQIPAKLLIENRAVINAHLARTRGGKVSFTHLIGYAVVEALVEMPSMNVRYTLDEKGKPAIEHFAHVGFGLAIDLPRPDGSRALMVPIIKQADTKTFKEFVDAYEEVVRRARDGKLTGDDFAGGTVTLTNPGTLGTTHSVPRLMKGQGTIIGVGATDYPAEWSGASQQRLAQLGVGKIMTMTSTYDHRVIQGAGSGEFLRTVSRKLAGQDGFYDRVFDSLQIPYPPYRWERDREYDPEREKDKPARIMEIIHAYRSRGHLAADTDPLAYKVRRHPDLAITNYGLNVWDLDRSFPTGGFGGRDHMLLREILDQLRDTYTRTVGIEYMHLQDPVQREWVQERIEHPWEKPSLETQRHIMTMLNKAEAFEHFLQTKYIGQKRFSLEGGESLIPLLDRILWVAAHEGVREVAIGMAHRGRLNVLANVAGKSYGQIFSEFEGNVDPRTVQGSGDVKYHLGTEGVFTADDGIGTKVYLAANPSHLEAADGVLEGIVRAKQDVLGEPGYPVVPILIHGDAAFIGQGVVYETLNMSQLRAYRNGGTIHVIVNNQIGFTTGPTSGRSTKYCTDLAKGLQVPIMHVNADDPEMVARVAKLAFDFRQEFNKDVIIDMVCYRRRGHNEGDDPSMTQPVMYELIDRTPTTRERYVQDLVGRGDITAEDAQKSLEEYNDLLNQILTETRENAKTKTGADTVSGLERPESQRLGQGLMIGWESPVPRDVIERIGDAHTAVPEGFTPHPKMMQLLEKRQQMSREGKIDWGFGELLAFGSLLMEGTPVRMSGQDARRATFVQRHATLHDHNNGREWTPLDYLVEEQPPFDIYDSSLSEYAPMAFEYGYSVERPDALVLWEAQFGDFANGAQTVIDEFISSAEQKWGQRSSVVLLLPHGYEGQGPDHSSARIERYLTLCAEDNMWIVQPSTPANHFHMLRTQAYKRPRKPLVVFTPKQLLRLPAATSRVEDFTSGGFQPVFDETDAAIRDNAASVDRVILCTGRVYYDIVKERERRKDTSTAVIRLEQYYPLATDELKKVLEPYTNAEIMWVQDEPRNQGAYPFLALNLFSLLDKPVTVASRPAAASPAAGTMALHKHQAEELMNQAFGR
ncbi:MAG: multifunctional oxoglutarate decarboxylase/oxoglutarate dehydrogenase thiamine pyrophosphate-binding subunit/dihydrolipoyllysine-residue succinyltransferase subunit [Actinomycetaceae bacterium]|nr:multifunctional oxoglutarate decarboxylase/oxoglutarate dehydrogenase thiamine pyrophosphate-binding subunit/dihydrolipoyllysine-residue succinyltransferase subunit [Actinomycetaceae bacterium]